MSIREKVQENIFGLFYAINECKLNSNKTSRAERILCSLIYLVDAGQMIMTFYLPNFGWNDDVVSYVKVIDIFQLFLSTVLPT